MNAPFVLDRPEIVHRAVCDTLVAVFPTIGRDALLSSERLNHTTAWVRQVGMFIMSGRLAVSQMQTSQLWHRDRTTVSHAIQLCQIEAAERPATAAFFDFVERQALAALASYVALEDEGRL